MSGRSWVHSDPTAPTSSEPSNVKQVSCNATVANKRCDWRGSREELAEHAETTTHKLCRLCSRSLRNAEPACCQDCVQQVRDDLRTITETFTLVPEIAHRSGMHNTAIPGGLAMILLADGSVDGGGPDDHIDFHDPLVPLAVLEANERDWRLTFGHGPAVEVATVAGCARYLLIWLELAARTLPVFEEFAGEIRSLAVRLEYVTGTVDRPETAPAKCFDCQTGTLISPYRAPLDEKVPQQRLVHGRRGEPIEGRDMAPQQIDPVTELPLDPEPIWECANDNCRAVYSAVSYRLAVRAAIETQAMVEELTA